jgi:hypothetical protein
MKQKRCSWCDKSFETNISYQIYCSVECREAATKEKIAERYVATRRKKMHGKIRKCLGCDTNLSAYNDEKLCQSCLIDPKEVSRVLREIRGYSNGKPIKDES